MHDTCSRSYFGARYWNVQGMCIFICWSCLCKNKFWKLWQPMKQFFTLRFNECNVKFGKTSPLHNKYDAQEKERGRKKTSDCHRLKRRWRPVKEIRFSFGEAGMARKCITTPKPFPNSLSNAWGSPMIRRPSASGRYQRSWVGTATPIGFRLFDS